MGEHQCPHCGHITTGFEHEDFHAVRNALIEECAALADKNPGEYGAQVSAAIRRLKK